MRDMEYTRERPKDVFRIALIGSSFVQGVGVENNETFDAVLENRLNDSPDRSASPRVEVLNFGVAGYTQMQHVGAVENKVFDFSPNIVFYVDHGDPFLQTMQGVVNHVRSGRIDNYEYLAKLASRAGVGRNTDPVEIKSKLQPLQSEILLWVYRRIVDKCKSQNVPAVWVYLPRPEEFDRGPSELQLSLAREAGFQVVILENVYMPERFRTVWLARWDHHPNARGHELIAQRLYEAIQKNSLIPATVPSEHSEGDRRQSQHQFDIEPLPAESSSGSLTTSPAVSRVIATRPSI
jgi:hypothetical protein